MRIIGYTEEIAAQWDAFVQAAAQGTFLHTRKFLSYHGSRFQDCSAYVEDDKGQLCGVFPAAVSPDDARSVVSHPGITFGGLLSHARCSPEEIYAQLSGILSYFRSRGYVRVLYRTVPCHAQKIPTVIDQHTLWLLGGRIVRRDLWNVFDLSAPRVLSEWHARWIKRAVGNGVTVDIGNRVDYLKFYEVLRDRLARRHQVTPAHTAKELLLIQGLFQDEVKLWIARDSEGQVIAGHWMFHYNDRAWHMQYSASSDVGRNLGASHLVVETIIKKATQLRVAVFSFGASSECHGRVVNAGLFAFKAGFGKGTALQDFIEVTL
jgi:Acetyltransferase (GNAT) domain